MSNTTVVSHLLPTLRAKSLSPTPTDALVAAALLSATCIYYFYYGNFWKGASSQLAGQVAEKGKVASLEDDPFRNCDFSNVKVSKILIHPIKSCRGTSVQEAGYDGKGLEYDRQLAIIDAQTHKVITAREKPKMVLIHPQIEANASDNDGGRVVISFPEGSNCETFAIPLSPSAERMQGWKRLDDVELWGQNDIDGYVCESVSTAHQYAPSEMLSRFLGKEVYLVLKGVRPRPCDPTLDFPHLEACANYQDGYPLLVASEESLGVVQERLRTEVGKQGVADRWKEEDLVMERFRPNIVLSGAVVPWAEDVWERIRIGTNASSIALVSKCARCLLPNVDPATGVRDAAVPYKVLMKFRRGQDPARLSKPCFGCNGVPAGPGIVRVGDAVSVLSRLPSRR